MPVVVGAGVRDNRLRSTGAAHGVGYEGEPEGSRVDVRVRSSVDRALSLRHEPTVQPTGVYTCIALVT